jgi:hypothetical protein
MVKSIQRQTLKSERGGYFTLFCMTSEWPYSEEKSHKMLGKLTHVTRKPRQYARRVKLTYIKSNSCQYVRAVKLTYITRNSC